MPLENTGNILKEIKIKAKTITLVFADESFDISHHAYTDQYLYVGKTLSRKEIELLKEQSQLIKLEKYAFNLLAKGMYSQAQVKDKLFKKGAKSWMVAQIIEQLINYKLINDDEYIIQRLEYGQHRNEGFYKIVNDLLAKGIDENKIKKLSYDEHNELEKAKTHLDNLLKKYRHLSMLALKKAIYEYYQRNGFPDSIIHSIINTSLVFNQNQQIANLKIELAKGQRKYNARYQGMELKRRLISYLSQKGYNYSDILNILGAKENDVD